MARIHHGTLTANTPVTVTLDEPYGVVTVYNRTTGTEIFFRADSGTLAVGGDDCEIVLGLSSTQTRGSDGENPTVVTLESAGAPSYSVVGSVL